MNGNPPANGAEPIPHAGHAAADPAGRRGALPQLLNFSLIAGGLFLPTGFLHHRVGSTDLLGLGGAARSMPLPAGFFPLFALAGMGVPGTNGFPAELLIIVATLKTHTGAGLAVLFGSVIAAAYQPGIYRRTFLPGDPAGEAWVARLR